MDKGTNVLDRMLCIGNPFGNEIEMQVCLVDPNVSYPAAPGDGKTEYDTSIVEVDLSSAVLVSFSILISKPDDKKY